MIKLKATKRWYHQAAKDEVGVDIGAGMPRRKSDPKWTANEIVVAITAIFLGGTLIMGVVQLLRLIHISHQAMLN